MMMLQQNVTEIMGSDEQMVAGKSGNETLGQDELARIGTKIREGGLQDRVRDWMIDQFRKEGTLIKQFSSAELHVQIKPEDYSQEMPVTPEMKWVEFGTVNNPLGAKHSLQGEFDYDMNVYEAIKPNKMVEQQVMEKMLTVIPTLEEPLLNDNCRIKTGLLAKEYLKTFDGIGNVDRFIEKLDSMQVAAIRTQKVLEAQAGGLVGQPKQTTTTKTEPPKDTPVSNRSSEMAKAE
jgi:hypothetical protein